MDEYSTELARDGDEIISDSQHLNVSHADVNTKLDSSMLTTKLEDNQVVEEEKKEENWNWKNIADSNVFAKLEDENVSIPPFFHEQKLADANAEIESEQLLVDLSEKYNEEESVVEELIGEEVTHAVGELVGEVDAENGLEKAQTYADVVQIESEESSDFVQQAANLVSDVIQKAELFSENQTDAVEEAVPVETATEEQTVGSFIAEQVNDIHETAPVEYTSEAASEEQTVGSFIAEQVNDLNETAPEDFTSEAALDEQKEQTIDSIIAEKVCDLHESALEAATSVEANVETMGSYIAGQVNYLEESAPVEDTPVESVPVELAQVEASPEEESKEQTIGSFIAEEVDDLKQNIGQFQQELETKIEESIKEGEVEEPLIDTANVAGPVVSDTEATHKETGNSFFSNCSIL